MELIKTYPGSLFKEIKFFYSVLAKPEEHGNKMQRRLPDGTLDIIFNLGDEVYISDNGTEYTSMPDISLTGLYHDKKFLYYKGKVHLIGAVFNPGFGHLFVNDKLTAHGACTQNATLIFGNAIYNLIEQMRELSGEKEKHFLLERFLFAQLQKSKDSYNIRRIELVINHIHLLNGHAEIKKLSKDHFMSERNFRRKFIEYVGLPPKRYASIIRVKTFCKSYKSGTVSYRQIADNLMYADTSHLYKDFRKITGTDPASYFRQMSLIGDKYIDLI
ncbi:MAG TPA: helix-turn-helix domain-containing protein [Puia sp.]|nr:helix-turn-helix domain-containing protein [Puia sp.]